ncbi:hypothetical protein [Salmonirosea aquatica]|uniref:Uncharacterized protein n=1 Tax=Salmonirosea aquatica TaxID=2654236 RepID=A0A7C9FEM4_9BACT|nr:hypothetical protein [Cytophagaceae bacterium SJW1-29]
MDEKQIFKITRKFYEDLLDDYQWLQMTFTDNLYETIEKVVSENNDKPIWIIKEKVNSAISHLYFNYRTVRLQRDYI